jgi:hypothetical protein
MSLQTMTAVGEAPQRCIARQIGKPFRLHRARCKIVFDGTFIQVVPVR